MSPSGDAAASVHEAVAAAHREHWGAVFAGTVGLTRDLDLAEDCAQQAFEQALTAWPQQGVPANPGGWLQTVSRRRALDVMRREASLRSKLPRLVWDEEALPGVEHEDHRIEDEDHAVVADEQLRLIFLAAHPALAPSSRIALTLRLVAGVPTERIAAAFLVPEATMAARLTRAKKRIVRSRIPCRVPAAEEIGGRLVDVLDVVSVLLTAATQREILETAVRILEVLVRLLPHHTEPAGLLAQALLLRARSATRHSASGRPIALADQDRAQWNREDIGRADSLVIDALQRGGRGPYLLQGAIAAAVAVPPRHDDVDWEEVIDLYDRLILHWPTAIVRLGRVVAVSEAVGASEALLEAESLTEDLASFRQFHVIRGELLSRVGEHGAADAAVRRAAECAGDDAASDLLREMMRRSRDD